jgi:hypothetical protein
MLKKILLTALLVAVSIMSVSAQQVINGDQSYVPGAWIGTQVPNAGTTGTTVNKIAKLSGTGTALISATTDLSGMIGIVGSGAGTTGNATIVQSGQVNCVFDGATTANDYVINSITTAGDCSDGGSTPPSVQSFGRVLSTNVGAGTYAVLVAPKLGTVTVSSGTAALGTSAITSGVCATVVTVSAPGVVASGLLTGGDIVHAGFSSDPTGVVGYQPGAMLTIVTYPTTNNVNFKVCNNTANSITPGAMTLGWSVQR